MSRVPAHRCRSCGKILDVALGTEKDGPTPEPGDVSICYKCSTISIYKDDMSLREPTEEELRKIIKETNTMQALQWLAELNKC